jgi:hypothetical protein
MQTIRLQSGHNLGRHRHPQAERRVAPFEVEDPFKQRPSDHKMKINLVETGRFYSLGPSDSSGPRGPSPVEG